MSETKLSILPCKILPNPDLGRGKFRRYLRFQRINQSHLIAALSDDFHAFQLKVCHNHSHLKTVASRRHRSPTCTSAGATAAIEQAAGQPLSSNVFQLPEHLHFKQHCSHIFDLLSRRLCTSTAARGSCLQNRSG